MGSQLMDAACRNPLSQAFLTRWANGSPLRNSKSATIRPSGVFDMPSVRPMGRPPEGDRPTESCAHMTTGFRR